jgi:hypothetical protein
VPFRVCPRTGHHDNNRYESMPAGQVNPRLQQLPFIFLTSIMRNHTRALHVSVPRIE